MTKTFTQYAKCMHCGLPLDANALDSTGQADCLDEYGNEILGAHDYDSEFPMGVYEDGTPI